MVLEIALLWLTSTILVLCSREEGAGTIVQELAHPVHTEAAASLEDSTLSASLQSLEIFLFSFTTSSPLHVGGLPAMRVSIVTPGTDPGLVEVNRELHLWHELKTISQKGACPISSPCNLSFRAIILPPATENEDEKWIFQRSSYRLA